MTENGDITEKDRVRIAGGFVLHAPPGEFNEVFNDVRLLLNNDQQLVDGCGAVFQQYNKDQFVPVTLPDHDKPTLITPFNDVGGGRFYDARAGKAFRYDHLRKEASEPTPLDPPPHPAAEPFRLALQSAADQYIANHFQVLDSKALGVGTSGVCAVFGGVDDASGQPLLHLCIESHKFEAKNYSNGRWRSQWSVVLTEKQAELKGLIKVQVHYYEDGNVQLVSSKEITRKINVTNDSSTAKEIINVVEQEETAYQIAMGENYENMSGTTFKALRRPLPVTKTKVDWQKIVNYRIGSELKM